MARLLAFAVVCFVLLQAAAGAESASAPKHPLTDLPASGSISVGHYFPDHPSSTFPAGSKVKVVLGVHNDASEVYNMTMVMGSVNSPSDFAMYIHNFTHQLYFDAVRPSEEISLEYEFQPHPQLPAREYIVALTAFYEDTKGNIYSTTFFNQTVNVSDVEKLVDTEMLFLYLTILGAVAAAGFALYQYVVGLGFVKTNKKQRLKQATSAAAGNDDEWLSGTYYAPKKAKVVKKEE